MIAVPKLQFIKIIRKVKYSRMKINSVGIEELKKNAPPFHAIIPGILVSIPCGFILSITITDTMMYHNPYHNPYHNLYPLIFPFCNILFSLILGIAISYGIKRKKYGNKRNIFILIVFCSFLIYFFFCIISMYILFKTGYACSSL
jgi:ABC-type spermidine/putrescine transport system permease subunit I